MNVYLNRNKAAFCNQHNLLRYSGLNFTKYIQIVEELHFRLFKVLIKTKFRNRKISNLLQFLCKHLVYVNTFSLCKKKYYHP